MSTTLGFEVRWDVDVAILRLDGALDLPGATALLATAGDLTRAGVRSIVCDLEGLGAVPDARLLTVFPTMQRRMGAWPEHTLYLAGASAGVGVRLVQLGIHRFVSVRPAVDDALLIAHAGEHATYRDLELVPESSSPGRARACLVAMHGPGSEPWHDGAALVVSELTTNAVRHVREPFTLGLALAPTQLLVTVTDPSRHEPLVRPPSADATDGRGMQVVAALSQSWGVRLIHGGGKSVWARLTPLAA